MVQVNLAQVNLVLVPVKDFVKEAGKRGIVVEFVLFCTLYDDALWKVSPFRDGNNINGVTARGTSDISYVLQQTLDSIRTTDQKVHDVGTAFEEINRQHLQLSASGMKPGSDPYAETLVNTDDTKIDYYATCVAGAAQANAR